MEEPTALETRMSMANVVFGWLGYDLWSEENEQEAKLQEASNSWIWVEQDGDRLSQDDFEFIENNQHNSTPLLSYADAVRASFERCKRDQNTAKVREENAYNTLMKKTINCNLAGGETMTHSADHSHGERLQMKIRPDRKRKLEGRYQPFPKNQKISFLERENITNYVLDRQIVPYNSGRITLINFMEPTVAIPKAKSNTSCHWITVGKEKCSFKPVQYPKVAKMRFVVDISDNNCITILRMDGDKYSSDSTSQKLKDICTIVGDVKQKGMTKLRRESAKGIQVMRLNRVKDDSGVKGQIIAKTSKRGKRITEKRREQKHYQTSHMLDPNDLEKSCIKFCIEQNIIPLQYILGVQHQPLSIEWPEKALNSYSPPHRIFNRLQFMEGVLTGILSIALSLSSIDVGDFGKSYEYENLERNQESLEKAKGTYKRSGVIRNTRGKKDSMKIQVYSYADFRHCKRNKKKNEFINSKKASNHHQKGKKKNRNFTPQKFSGRGGARGC